MSNVISLGTAEKPEVEIIQLLEDLLELAHAGEIRGLAIGGLSADLNPITTYCCNPKHKLALLGSVEFIKERLMRAGDREEDEL